LLTEEGVVSQERGAEWIILGGSLRRAFFVGRGKRSKITNSQKKVRPESTLLKGETNGGC